MENVENKLTTVKCSKDITIIYKTFEQVNSIESGLSNTIQNFKNYSGRINDNG